MAPLFFALALFAQDAAAGASDGPMATAVPRKQDVAALPIQGGAVSAPTDDYGYVGWCYGAISAYVELYDLAMPEVTRIERAWPTPGTEENLSKVYPAQRDEAKQDILLFVRAMQAAEKASPSPIQTQGADAIRRGRAVWTGATSVPKAQLAQFWMSWSPPAKCGETAKTLEARSLLLGQALTYNMKPVVVGSAPVAAPADPVVAATEADPVPAAPAPEGEPAAAPAQADGGDAPATTVDSPASAPAEAPAIPEAAPASSSAIDDLLPAPAATPATAPPEAAAPTAPAPARAKRGKGAKPVLRGAQ